VGTKLDVVFPTTEMESEEDEKTATIYSILNGGMMTNFME